MPSRRAPAVLDTWCRRLVAPAALLLAAVVLTWPYCSQSIAQLVNQ